MNKKLQAFKSLMADLEVFCERLDEQSSHAYILVIYDPETSRSSFVGPLSKDKLPAIMEHAMHLQATLTDPDGPAVSVTIHHLFPSDDPQLMK